MYSFYFIYLFISLQGTYCNENSASRRQRVIAALLRQRYPLQLDVVGGEAHPETLFLFTFRQVFC